MFGPIFKGIGHRRQPEGPQGDRQAVVLARSEEGKKLIAQARKVAATPEGRRLVGEAAKARRPRRQGGRRAREAGSIGRPPRRSASAGARAPR